MKSSDIIGALTLLGVAILVTIQAVPKLRGKKTAAASPAAAPPVATSATEEQGTQASAMEAVTMGVDGWRRRN